MGRTISVPFVLRFQPDYTDRPQDGGVYQFFFKGDHITDGCMEAVEEWMGFNSYDEDGDWDPEKQVLGRYLLTLQEVDTVKVENNDFSNRYYPFIAPQNGDEWPDHGIPMAMLEYGPEDFPVFCRSRTRTGNSLDIPFLRDMMGPNRVYTVEVKYLGPESLPEEPTESSAPNMYLER